MGAPNKIVRCDHVSLEDGQHIRCSSLNTKPARGGHFCPAHIQGKEITYAKNRKRFQSKPKHQP